MGTLRPQHWRKLFDLHPEWRTDHYVETGLWNGKQLHIAVRYFRNVYGIELNRPQYDRCIQETKHMPDVDLRLGDTRDLLPVVSEELADVPVTFLLDAHWCKTNPPIPMTDIPLWDELDVLAERNQPDVVIVDDVHAFGRDKRDKLKQRGYEGWETIVPKNLANRMNPDFHRAVGDSYVMWMRGELL